MRRNHGAVMVITLLSVVLLAALVLYVMNLGWQTAARVSTQQAADSTAAGGAGWVARSLNTVAMNNVAMAQLIAAVNVLDSVPLAVDFSIKDDSELVVGDETAMFLAVDHQLRIGMSEDVFRRELERTRTELGQPEVKQAGSDELMLSQLNDYFKSNPQVIQNATHYLAPGGGNGSMWRAMRSLDEYSQTVMENLGVLAHVSAVRSGEANLPEEGTSVAVMSPAVPSIPWKRGTFSDFRRPVMQGLLPDGVDDKVIRRGPYDAVLGWRDPRPRGTNGGAFRGNPPGYAQPTPVSAQSYSNFGPHEFLLRHFDNTLYGRLPRHLRRVAYAKISYLWPSKRDDTNPDTLIKLVDPDWETDIENDNERSRYPALAGMEGGDQDEKREKLTDAGAQVLLCDDHATHRTAYQYASDQQHRRENISETMFLVLDLYHREKDTSFPESEQWGQSSSPSWFINRDRIRPRYVRGWHDPVPGPYRRSNPNTHWKNYAGPDVPLPPGGQGFYEYRQITSGRYAWKEVSEFWTDPTVTAGQYAHGAYPELGIDAVQIGVDSLGQPFYRSNQYWRTRYILFVGCNVGLKKVVRDPYVGFNPFARNAPAPTDLDHSLVTTSDEARRQYLTFLAVTRREEGALGWGSRFTGAKPYPYLVSIAQAQVFNNHSWDLWTQMWHAQLQPVARLDDWSDRMRDDATSLDVPGVNPDDYDDLGQYLHTVAPLADVMLSH